MEQPAFFTEEAITGADHAIAFYDGNNSEWATPLSGVLDYNEGVSPLMTADDTFVYFIATAPMGESLAFSVCSLAPSMSQAAYLGRISAAEGNVCSALALWPSVSPNVSEAVALIHGEEQLFVVSRLTGSFTVNNQAEVLSGQLAYTTIDRNSFTPADTGLLPFFSLSEAPGFDGLAPFLADSMVGVGRTLSGSTAVFRASRSQVNSVDVQCGGQDVSPLGVLSIQSDTFVAVLRCDDEMTISGVPVGDAGVNGTVFVVLDEQLNVVNSASFSYTGLDFAAALDPVTGELIIVFNNFGPFTWGSIASLVPKYDRALPSVFSPFPSHFSRLLSPILS